jgi:hypothetical protein
MERDLAAAAELGVSQAATTEIVKHGLPAQIDGAGSRHGVVSRTGPLAPPESSSPGVTRLCRCASPDGHQWFERFDAQRLPSQRGRFRRRINDRVSPPILRDED